MPDLSNLGLVLSIPLFIAAAVAVWLSGVRLTHYANAISEKTGMGQALAGILLLGGVTSLPELAVSVTSTLSGDVVLAVNGILGGIAMQVAIGSPPAGLQAPLLPLSQATLILCPK